MGRAVQPHIITPDSVLGGRNIERSVRFNTADSTEFYNNSLGTSMTGNRQICTASVWIKKINTSASGMIEYGYSGSGASASGGGLKWDSSSRFFVTQEVNNSTVWKVATTRVFRDFTNWYHVVAAVDTTQGTASNRVKIYVNGVQETDFSTSSYPSQNYSSNNLGYNKCRIGASNGYAAQLYYSGFNGYLAEYHFIDGQQLDPSYFGYTESQTGIWRPKKVTGVTYGNNGHYLDFRDNSNTTTLGYDRSGNGLNFASNNISVSAGVGNDSLEDTPTNNFSILSPLYGRGSYFQTPSQGGLNFSLGSHTDVMSSFVIPDSGKWYAEFVFTTVGSGAVGVCNLDKKNDGTSAASALNGINYNGSDIKVNDSSVQSSLTAIGNNDVIGVQVDRDAGTVQFTNDGSNVGTPVNISSMNAPFDIMFNLYRNSSGGSTPVGYANFGQRPFSYLPSGFRSLCDKNMATPTASSIVDPKKHFKCLLYTPNSGNLSVTGVGFKPDLLWLKSHTQGYRHYMFDSIRGTGAKAISSNLDAVEGNDSGGALGSFDSDGFSVGGSTGFNDNGSGTNGCVAWCWKAGISTSSNTAGDVTSTVSVNDEAGFSIVSFTTPASGSGFSIGHGLSKAPETIWMKNRDAANNWDVYHHENGSNPEQYRLKLNSTSAREDQPYLDDTVPTSSVFRTRSGGNWYANSEKIIAYCFYSVPGFSKMGSYKGTGATNGPFVYTGFRPAMIIIKRIDATEDWWIHDNQRNPYNPINKNLYPNEDNTTATEVASDFLSNGFKLRTGNQNWNYDGHTYVYWAWAEQVGNTPYIASTNAR